MPPKSYWSPPHKQSQLDTEMCMFDFSFTCYDGQRLQRLYHTALKEAPHDE